MITIRRSEERGHFDHGWLDTRHTFSFAGYFDPRHMGFRVLRVINEDRVRPGSGFGTHAHSDMEILSLVFEGSLEHRDSMGNGSIIRAGDVQRMTAGTGVTHSEKNPSETEPVHFLQVWILPERQGLAPGYEQRTFAEEEKRGRLRLIASRDGRDGSVSLHQDADVYATILGAGEEAIHRLRPGRSVWVQVVRGDLALNGELLMPGDGAGVCEEKAVTLATPLRMKEGLGRVPQAPAEALLFDLP